MISKEGRSETKSNFFRSLGSFIDGCMPDGILLSKHFVKRGFKIVYLSVECGARSSAGFLVFSFGLFDCVLELPDLGIDLGLDRVVVAPHLLE